MAHVWLDNYFNMKIGSLAWTSMQSLSQYSELELVNNQQLNNKEAPEASWKPGTENHSNQRCVSLATSVYPSGIVAPFVV